jgi:hypothetical protein
MVRGCGQHQEHEKQHEQDGSERTDVDVADETRRPRVSFSYFNSDSGETSIVPVRSAVGEITIVINTACLFPGASSSGLPLC